MATQEEVDAATLELEQAEEDLAATEQEVRRVHDKLRNARLRRDEADTALARLKAS